MNDTSPSRPASYGHFGLPLPQGQASNAPRTFDEVAPVVAAFVRDYMSGPYAEWYRRPDTLTFALAGSGGSTGGTPYNQGWIDLVSAPVLLIDEEVEHLSKPTPRNAGEFVPLNRCPSDFPADLLQSLRLVVDHDRQVLAQRCEEVRTYAQTQETLPRQQRDPSEKSSPLMARWASMSDAFTCLGKREEWLNTAPTPEVEARRKGPRP